MTQELLDDGTAEAERLERLANEALQAVKRTAMSPLSRVFSLLVLDEAYRKAGRLRRSALRARAQQEKTK